MDSKIIVTFAPQGLASADICADTEKDQAALEELLDSIQPCLDVADAILKKTSAGPRG